METLTKVSSKLTIEKKDLPHGQFQAVLATGDLDRHGEHVSVKGMSIPKDQTIKMYYNHETNGLSLPIGIWNRVWKSGDQLKGIGEADLDDEFAVKVYKKIQKGYIDSISVGFYPEEFDGEDSTWTKSELVEASVVAEPANPKAQITAKELGLDQDEFDKQLKERSENNGKDAAVDTELQGAVEELKSRVGSVEEALQASAENPATESHIRVRMAGKKVDQAAEALNKKLKVRLREESSDD